MPGLEAPIKKRNVKKPNKQQMFLKSGAISMNIENESKKQLLTIGRRWDPLQTWCAKGSKKTR